MPKKSIENIEEIASSLVDKDSDDEVIDVDSETLAPVVEPKKKSKSKKEII